MVSSVKTEIIYYCGPTDFEFEFNLNGSCHMRLLTSVANDNTSLLRALQRSITRSKIILIIGEIKGENGIISLVSKSIGYATQKLDTNIYNAKNSEDAVIVDGSVPLITSGGDFGGCIIESGPQSMIFLTEDKKIRKQLMNELVHTYINDLSRYPSELIKETVPAEVTLLEETEAEPTEEPIAEAPIVEDEPEAMAEIEETAEVIEENPNTEDLPETAEEQKNEEFEEISSDSHIIDPYNINNIVKAEPTYDELLKPTVYEDEDYETHKGPKHLKSNKTLDIVSLILAFLLLVIFAFVIYSFVYLPLVNGIPLMENLKNTFAFLNL